MALVPDMPARVPVTLLRAQQQATGHDEEDHALFLLRSLPKHLSAGSKQAPV